MNNQFYQKFQHLFNDEGPDINNYYKPPQNQQSENLNRAAFFNNNNIFQDPLEYKNFQKIIKNDIPKIQESRQIPMQQPLYQNQNNPFSQQYTPSNMNPQQNARNQNFNTNRNNSSQRMLSAGYSIVSGGQNQNAQNMYNVLHHENPKQQDFKENFAQHYSYKNSPIKNENNYQQYQENYGIQKNNSYNSIQQEQFPLKNQINSPNISEKSFKVERQRDFRDPVINQMQKLESNALHHYNKGLKDFFELKKKYEGHRYIADANQNSHTYKDCLLKRVISQLNDERRNKLKNILLSEKQAR